MYHVSDSPALPHIEVNPLRDFNFLGSHCAFPEAFASPAHHSPPPIREHFQPPAASSLTEMLPAFNAFFGRDFNEVTESQSSSDDGSSTLTAPLWTPPAPQGPVPREDGARRSVPFLSPSPPFSPPSPSFSPPSLPFSPPSPPFSPPSPPASPAPSVSPPPSSPPPKCRVRRVRSSRLTANYRERRRTKILVDAFSALREHIPLPEKDKATKLQTLQAAASYIEFLHELHAVEAYKNTHGEIPLDTKMGITFALAARNRGPLQSPANKFGARSEALASAFNLYLSETKVSLDPLIKQEPLSPTPSPTPSTTPSSPTPSAKRAAPSDTDPEADPEAKRRRTTSDAGVGTTTRDVIASGGDPLTSPCCGVDSRRSRSSETSSTATSSTALWSSAHECGSSSAPGPWSWDY